VAAKLPRGLCEMQGRMAKEISKTGKRAAET
jgi:hypothetical protein